MVRKQFSRFETEDSVVMDNIVELGCRGDSDGEKLGDLLLEVATSDGESIDSVESVREMRECD